MKIDYNPPESESTDYVELHESLQRLDRTTVWFWWNGISTLVVLVATMLALLQPGLTQWRALPYQANILLMVRIAFVLVLFSNAFTLYHHHHIKGFRTHFADQIKVTLKQQEDAKTLYGLAILDSLTGLYNRRFGEECLQKEIQKVELNRTDLSVIALDLNYFKVINDQYGHAAGDMVLKEFSRNLKRAIRTCDMPIRIGGDEFLVVLPDCSRENVQLILSRLKPFEVVLNGEKVTVSYSRGKAQYQVGDTPQKIIHRADQSMYAEKASRATSTA